MLLFNAQDSLCGRILARPTLPRGPGRVDAVIETHGARALAFDEALILLHSIEQR